MIHKKTPKQIKIENKIKDGVKKRRYKKSRSTRNRTRKKAELKRVKVSYGNAVVQLANMVRMGMPQSLCDAQEKVVDKLTAAYVRIRGDRKMRRKFHIDKSYNRRLERRRIRRGANLVVTDVKVDEVVEAEQVLQTHLPVVDDSKVTYSDVLSDSSYDARSDSSYGGMFVRHICGEDDAFEDF